MPVKIFGITLGKQTKPVNAPPNGTQGQTNGDKRAKRASTAIRKQPRYEISWQIEDIKRAISLAENPQNPDRKRMLQIFRFIMRDGHLKSQIRTAKSDILSEPFALYKNDETIDNEATKLIQKRWFTDIIEYKIDAEMWGYSLVEADDISPKEGSKGGVISIDREYVSIEKQYILLDGWINGAYLPYADYMNEMDLLQFGKPDDYGLLLECAYNVIWKFYSRSDWSRGSEKFGMPILSIIADTNNESELDALERRAANFGADGYYIGQKGDEVTMLETKNQRGHDVWLDNINLSNDEISKIINGQTATSDEKSFTGAAEVQERTMKSFTQTRLQGIADEMNESVMPYLIYKGFPFKGLKFDYPALQRTRKQRINGTPTVTDAPGQPDAPNQDEQPTKQDEKPTKPKQQTPKPNQPKPNKNA